MVETGEEKEIPADTVIAAVGERVPTAFYESCGINVNERGRAIVNEETCETSRAGVYLAGDGLGGPATVVEGISDALRAAQAILGETLVRDFEPETDEDTIYGRKGNISDKKDGGEESGRCLGCSGICENCVEVCPNRANISIRVPGMEKHQIIHVDYMCNECGNCKSFCPYDSAPYLDKFTLSQMRKIWKTAGTRDSRCSTKIRCNVRYASSARHISGQKARRQGYRTDFRN